MSIKNDRWIRKMAAQGMIEPFAKDQVRLADGHKIVSYGTSSYGYDVRCAEEFKIFTNINSTIVDPKNFDEKSFVDFKGPVCIIPPNSFALARTVEYFRIPRSTLVVCLGKCVTGDTRVVDADSGAYLPITEMRWGKSTLAMDGAELKRARVSDFIPQGKKPVFELRTRSGLRIRATANHPFKQRNRWTPLSELQPGDEIAAARSIPVFGKTPMPDWEASLLGLMVSAGRCNDPGQSPIYQSSDPAMVKLLAKCASEAKLGTVVPAGAGGYHLDGGKGQGEPADASPIQLWLSKYTLNVDASVKRAPQAIFKAPERSVRLFLQSLFASEIGNGDLNGSALAEYHSSSRTLIEDVHHLLLRFGVLSRICETSTNFGATVYKVQINDATQLVRFSERVGLTPQSARQDKLETQVLLLGGTKCGKKRNLQGMEMVAAHGDGGYRSRACAHSSMDPDRDTDSTEDWSFSASISGPVWDVVEHIQPAGDEEVFDISVPLLHNFVANDLIVHNSTYARCFRGDTRVALVDGTAPTLEEMARRADAGEIFWGYSIGENGRMIVSLLDAPRYIGRDALLEIELDDGAVVRATPDHLFMRRDGRMAEAHKLRPGDALMPLYRDLFRGYEEVYQPVEGFMCATHRLADEWNLRHGIYVEAPGTHRHHIDFDRRNNCPTNITRLEASKHIRLHNAVSYGEEFDPEEHGRAISASIEKRALDPAWKAHYAKMQSNRATHFWRDDRYAAIRRQLIEARRNPSDERREAHRKATLKRFSDPAERLRYSKIATALWDGNVKRRRMQAEVARGINLRAEITEETVRRALDDTGSIRGAAAKLNSDRSVFRRFPPVVASLKGAPTYRNHKVAAIRELSGDHDVYCLTVPEAGNFALEAGIFVHNCGIIVNVTPLEPEWEGHVTLEFSNTTPLPAKIYANEGVAQMLFFESDEVCETSYADKGGKYQGQRGVTLPKT